MATKTAEMQQNGIKDVNAITNGIPLKPSDVVPINYEAAFASFSPQEQQDILDLSQSIDVRKIDNVMHYGEAALKSTFEQCGAFLKDERGSQADQDVIEQVIRLSKKAGESYEYFNLVLKEPNLLQKLFTKLFTGGKGSQTEKVQESAVTNYKLLVELKDSCDSWLEMLKKAMGDITASGMSDVENAGLLEKYIIAGKMAEERIGQELEEIHTQYQQTGLQKYAQEYEEIKEGYDIFTLKMNNLEKSRVMYYLSVGQLSLIKRANRNVQISINTQVSNSMALMGQQLRNAVLNAKTREVLDGQKALARLNDELVVDISKTVGLTTEETEKLIYAGFYNVEAAKTAVMTVINSCQAIQKTATEMLPKMKADMTELNSLIQDLEPYINPVQNSDENVADNGNTNSASQLNF